MVRMRAESSDWKRRSCRLEQGPPLAVRFNFVERDGTVVETRVFEMCARYPAPRNRGWRAAQRSWPARRRS